MLTLTASVLSLEQSEKKQGFEGLWWCWWLFLPLKETSDVLNLDDLRDRSKMLVAPMRLPRVMLLSRKNDPVDCILIGEKQIQICDSANCTKEEKDMSLRIEEQDEKMQSLRGVYLCS